MSREPTRRQRRASRESRRGEERRAFAARWWNAGVSVLCLLGIVGLLAVAWWAS